MIFVICIIAIILFSVSFIFTIPYKREYRAGIHKSGHRLLFLYGLSMFLADKPFKRVVSRNMSMMEERFKKLYVKENVKEDVYLYMVSKISMTLVTIFGVMIFCVLVNITASLSNETITYLERDPVNENTVDIIVDSEGKQEEMQISVLPRQYTEEEISDLLEGYKQELLNELLADNKSQDRIDQSLNFVLSIGEEKIPVLWEIENKELIHEDGTLGNNINKNGENTKVYATLSIKNISVTHEIPIKVFPDQHSSGVKNYIQNMVDESDITDKKVKLPDSYNGNKISYRIGEKDESGILFAIGVAVALFLFVLKDRDINKHISERNKQMLSDYTQVVSSMMLLLKSGMTMRNAWNKTINDNKNKLNHYVYKEMRLTSLKINKGISESVAYEQFGRRCGMHCYIRLSNILSQNLKRGSSNICNELENELKNALMERKNSALKIGEEAGTKLLVPMVMMLIVGLVLIIAPAFMSVKI